ncbi:MAG: cobalamide ABC transporter substrate-binding protein, partial [Candidatus Omnitrophota bacterium]
PNRRVFVQIGTKPLFAASTDSFINSIVEFAGGTNIASGSKSGLYSREKVVKEDPDVILIATMGLIGESEKKAWENYRTIKAVKESGIHIVDQYKFCCATPGNFVSALEDTVEILYPDNE